MDRVLRKLGFARIRQKGSHVFYRHADGRTTTVPHHKSRDLAVPLVRAILADIASRPTTSCTCSNPSHLLGSGSIAPTGAEKASHPAGLAFVRCSPPVGFILLPAGGLTRPEVQCAMGIIPYFRRPDQL